MRSKIIITIFLVFLQIPLFALQFGSLNLGKEVGFKTIREWKLNISSPPDIEPPRPNDPRLVWVSQQMEGRIYWPSVDLLLFQLLQIHFISVPVVLMVNPKVQNILMLFTQLICLMGK